MSLTLLGQHDTVAGVAFPYFGGIENPHFRSVKHDPVLVRQLPVKNLTLADGTVCPVVSVYDLVLANYGLDRGLEDENSAKDYAEIKPYTPAWGEQITGVPRQYIETIAREFADTAHKTHGRSMIILGAGVNHWYHMDMNYRGMINMLIFCGCVGQSGGGWAHYVGQEKLRPQTGWLPLAFALDWNRPPRQMNSTSFFYNHSSQWRYEKVTAQELLSPLADASKYSGHLIDFNVRAERMGWLPSAPQLGRNPLSLKAEADKAGLSPTEFTAQALKSGDLRMACEQPDSGSNHPRNLFVCSLSFANPTVRAWLFQILAVVAVVGIVGWLFHNTVTNLNNRGITSGFAFLDRGAGFGIVQHLIDYQQGDTYGRVFIVGLLNTLLVSALCIVFASVLGFFIGLARLSDNWLLRKLSTIYIEIFRNIPPLLQIFFWYFAVLRNLPGPRQAVSAFDLAFLSNRGLYIPSPQLGDGFIAFILAVVMAIVLSVGLFRFNKTYQIKTGQLRRTWPIAAVLIIGLPLLAQWLFGAALHWDVPALRGFNFRGGMVLIPELAALTLALSVYTSAFIAEIIRAGIQAVPYGQHEAARSLGLPNPVTLRQVIIPQALRVIIPPLTSQYLNIVKNSSLAAAIGYPDMVSLFAGTVLNQTGQAIETIAMTMSVYLIISLTISLLMNIYNRRIAIVER